MEWNEIRQTYPHRWLLVEALEAHSQSGKRILEDLAVVDTFPDGTAAMQGSSNCIIARQSVSFTCSTRIVKTSMSTK